MGMTSVQRFQLRGLVGASFKTPSLSNYKLPFLSLTDHPHKDSIEVHSPPTQINSIMATATFVEVLLAIFLPPAGVFLRYGLGVRDLSLSLSLSLYIYIYIYIRTHGIRLLSSPDLNGQSSTMLLAKIKLS